jgi:hypothetical protein
MRIIDTQGFLMIHPRVHSSLIVLVAILAHPAPVVREVVLHLATCRSLGLKWWCRGLKWWCRGLSWCWCIEDPGLLHLAQLVPNSLLRPARERFTAKHSGRSLTLQVQVPQPVQIRGLPRRALLSWSGGTTLPQPI